MTLNPDARRTARRAAQHLRYCLEAGSVATALGRRGRREAETLIARLDALAHADEPERVR